MDYTYYCQNCHAPVAYGTNFCPNCGARLTWQTETRPTYIQEMQPQYAREKTAAPDWKFGLIFGICLAVVAIGGLFAYGLLSPLPMISGVSANVVSGSTAVITWQTDITSTSQVDYGTTAQYGSESVVNASAVTNHSITLQGLTSKTTYHCRAKSKGSNWSSAVSSDLTFTTQ